MRGNCREVATPNPEQPTPKNYQEVTGRSLLSKKIIRREIKENDIARVGLMNGNINIEICKSYIIGKSSGKFTLTTGFEILIGLD